MEVYEKLKNIIATKIRNGQYSNYGYPSNNGVQRNLSRYEEEDKRILDARRNGAHTLPFETISSSTLYYYETRPNGPSIFRKLLVSISFREFGSSIDIVDYEEGYTRRDPISVPFLYAEINNTLRDQLYDIFEFWLDTPKNTFNEENFVRAYNQTRDTNGRANMLAFAMGTDPRLGAQSEVRRMRPELISMIQEEYMWRPITDGVTFSQRPERLRALGVGRS